MSTENKWFAMSRKTDAEGKQSSEAEISINDNIGGWGITANDFIADMKDLGDVDTINVRISSGGGSIVEGNAIFNALKRHPAKIVTHIDSIAASMASVIAMAGDEVRMAANALFMIHNPWTASIGGAMCNQSAGTWPSSFAPGWLRSSQRCCCGRSSAGRRK